MNPVVESNQSELNRRNLASRQLGFFQKLANQLTVRGVTPNQISVISIVFALIGAIAFLNLPSVKEMAKLVFLSLATLVGIQGRLLCNLLDGLVAIEGGKKTALGDLFNDVPDRIADVILFSALGFGLGKVEFTWGPVLGVFASLISVFTSYIRLLGGSLGLKQSFRGPLAKQHRMALISAGVLLNVLEFLLFRSSGFLLYFVLWIVVIGGIVTSYLRLKEIGLKLNQRSGM